MQYTLYSLLRTHVENMSEKSRKIISWVTYKTETAILLETSEGEQRVHPRENT